MSMIENESGRFYVDDCGTLQHFECGAKNSLSLPYSPESKSLFHLHIPEGICSLPTNAFRGFAVHNDVTFPDSLIAMNAGAFSCCALGYMVLPKCAKLGTDVFSGSCIEKVTIPEGMDPERAQQAAHALRFTRSSNVFNDLAKEWPSHYADIFYGRNESIEDWTQIRNSSGTFYLDSDGVLRDFCCAHNNYADRANISNTENVLLRLIIPEGVKVIPGEMFARFSVLWELTFPKTLKCIGTVLKNGNAFAHSTLPDVVLPEKLELLGNFAFGICTARSVTIPASLRGHLNYRGSVRDFKDSSIGEIRMPAEYRETLEDICKNSWYSNDELEIGDMYDPKLGQLCYIKSKCEALRGGVIISRLLQLIACNG